MEEKLTLEMRQDFGCYWDVAEEVLDSRETSLDEQQRPLKGRGSAEDGKVMQRVSGSRESAETVGVADSRQRVAKSQPLSSAW